MLAQSSDVYDYIDLLTEQSSQFHLGYQHLDRYLSFAKNELEYDQIFLTDKDGNIIYSTINKEQTEGVNISHRDYYQQAIKGNQAWSPLIETVLGFNAMMLSTPVYEDGFSNKVIGTITFLINEEKLTDVVHSGTAYLGETGDAYLVNSEGLLLSNTRRGDYVTQAVLNETMETKATEWLKDPILLNDRSFRTNDQYKNYLGEDVLGTVSTLQMGDELVGLVIEVGSDEVFASLYSLRNYIFLALIIVSIFGAILANVFAVGITKPIKETVRILKQMANQDFSESLRKENISRKDEIGLMFQSIDKMQAAMKGIIRQVMNSSTEVSLSSKQLSVSADETKVVSKDVSASIVEVAQGAELQVTSSTETETVMEDMAKGIQRVAETAALISESTKIMNGKANDGGKTLTIAVEQMKKIEQETEQTTQIVDRLQQDSIQINEIIHIITSITDQTNLLALNAAIEAARAGEAGKGFAVVADEIRKLADQTRHSATQISDLVGNMQNHTMKASESMILGKREVAQGIDDIKDVGLAFNIILSSISTVANEIEELSAVSQQMSASAEQVTASVSEMATVAKQSAANAEEVAAASEEQLATIEEVSKASDYLRNLATSLQETVNTFQI
ncbi:MAG: methyl-accepting chemotaxis protein [Bacillaceae bacterium]|nr:methyl-accepting chemotaxis protein [Bacillaceae bacterium]